MDSIRDNSRRTLIMVTSMVRVPDYVSNHSPVDTEDAVKLAASQFADMATRMFPIDSPASTWLSNAYFHINRGRLAVKEATADIILGRINEAGQIYGIEKDLKEVTDQLSVMAKEASADSDDANYGWIVKDASGRTTGRRYFIGDADGVRKAANYFATYRDKYPFQLRKSIAGFILKKASQHSVLLESLPGLVQREAGMGVPNIANLRDDLERRAIMCKDAEIKAAFNDLSSMICSSEPEEVAKNLDKIAELLDEYDRTTGLDKKYGKGILTPADIVYEVTLKEAQDSVDSVVKLAAYVFDVRKLSELGTEVFECMGPDFVAGITKNGCVDPAMLKSSLDKLSAVDKHILESELKRI